MPQTNSLKFWGELDLKFYNFCLLFICEKIIAFSARKRIYAYNTTLLILCHLIIYNIISFKLVSGESIEYGLIRFFLIFWIPNLDELTYKFKKDAVQLHWSARHALGGKKWWRPMESGAIDEIHFWIGQSDCCAIVSLMIANCLKWPFLPPN